MRIAGYALSLGRDEIEREVDLSTVPAGTNVRAYVLVHEGTSHPRDRDTGEPLALRWGKAIVRRVAALVRNGTRFVRSHADRTPLGEVLGSWTAEVGGKLRAIVAGAFPPDAATGMDVCSIEAGGVEQEGGFVTDVGTVDAIALGRSDVDTPGFAGAVLVGNIQCFTDGDGTGGGGVDSPGAGGEDTGMTLQDIVKWLETNVGVTPGQLFSDEKIAAHPAVADRITKLQSENADLTGQLSRRNAKDRMREKVKEWTPEAQFHADTAFDGWSGATDKPAELDEWLKTTAERYKGRTGVDVLPSKDDEDGKGTGDGSGAGGAGAGSGTGSGAGAGSGAGSGKNQPNQPPTKDGDPVVTLQQQLGIVKQDAA